MAKTVVPAWAREYLTWYKKFLSAMKKKYGDDWQTELEIPEDVGKSLLAMHQNALLVLAVDKQDNTASQQTLKCTICGAEAYPTPTGWQCAANSSHKYKEDSKEVNPTHAKSVRHQPSDSLTVPGVDNGMENHSQHEGKQISDPTYVNTDNLGGNVGASLNEEDKQRLNPTIPTPVDGVED